MGAYSTVVATFDYDPFGNVIRRKETLVVAIRKLANI
jgi:hypothetical protein